MQKQPFVVGGGGNKKFEDLGGQGLKNVRTGGLPFGGEGLLLLGQVGGIQYLIIC